MKSNELMELNIEAKYVGRTEKEFLNNVTYDECLYILDTKNKYCDDIKNLSLLKIVDIVNEQSKEIEELKKENKEIRDWKYVIDNPIDLKKLSELDIIKIFGKSYIAKDIIKAKIEEVEQWELYNMKIPRLSTLDERLGAKIGIKYVLQSLLEKE